MSTISDKFKDCTQKAIDASASIGEKVGRSAIFVKETANTIATTLLDQDGDGKFDQNDVKILTQKGKELAGKVSDEVCAIAKEATKSDLVKEAAAGAAVGAVIAVPVPLIGPVAGAAVGAALGTYTHVVKAVNTTKK